MSDVWNEGYFTDVDYTYGYYREISPVFQRYCLLINGYAAPEPQGGNHCELGFGQGVSINIHAAATPGQFVGTDFNPGHAAHANTLAEASGSAAHLYDDSFEQLLNRTDLPQFDSISLHGIWTWVSRDNHKIIAEFARRHLKPGGVFYNSYNCFPGWSPAYPLRQLFVLHDRFSGAGKNATERVDAALSFAENLLAANPNYLKLAPQLTERLKTIKEHDRSYLAHEYFNRDWNCMYFTDVVDALAPAKLDYASSASPLDTIAAINLRADAIEFLKGIEHPVIREQARDYFINQQFRKDLYVRGARRLLATEQVERLLDTRFILLQEPSTISLKVKGPAGEANLQEDVYRPLVAFMAAQDYRPKTLRQLAADLKHIQFPLLHQATSVLVGMGVAAPCQSEAAAGEVKQRCKALNDHLCQRARLSKEIETLASPVTGGGVTVGRFQQLFLLAIAQGRTTPAEWAESAWQLLGSQGQRIVKEGKALATPEENLAELTAQATEFGEKRLPILKALQIA